MSIADLGRARFAYSPLAEVAESLFLLSSRRLSPPHQGWLARVGSCLDRVDLGLLTAVVPARTFVADFFFAGATDRATSIEQQLRLLANTPVEKLRQDLDEVWRGGTMPPVGQELISDEVGPRRLADAVWEYWLAAIEPHWAAMRAVLDDDVAYRATELTRRGVEGLLAAMHPELSVHDDMLRIEKKRHPGYHEDHDLSGSGLLLVPSIFAWPNLIFATSTGQPSSLTYPARGVGNVWGTAGPAAVDEDALGALLGRSRAAILAALAIPHSTTELALSLGQSPPSVSQHLSVLRRSGLVISWRSGRKVLYRRTPLATSIVEASSSAHDDLARKRA